MGGIQLYHLEVHILALPIIPWIGGKRRLADRIIPQFPPHTCHVEVFAGAAALYFMRPPAEVEVLNDVNGELINRWVIIVFGRLCQGIIVQLGEFSIF